MSSGLALVWTCVRKVNDPSRVGLAVSFSNMPVSLSFALLQWLTGVILDAHLTGASVAGARVYPARRRTRPRSRCAWACRSPRSSPPAW